MRRHASELVPHPRIFIYNNSLLTRFLATQSQEALREWAFGRRLRDGMWGTDTWATANILIYKLQLHPEWITQDASLADLFVMPLVPRRPTYGAAVGFAADVKVEVSESCRHLFHDPLDQTYAHLTEDTARSHLFAAVDYTPILAFCAMSGTFGARPRSHRLLQRMRWLVHEEFEPADRAPHRYYSFSPGLPGTPGAMALNVPFPSGAAHERAQLPRGPPSDRPYLVSYSGSLSGSPENRRLRTTIARQCRAHEGLGSDGSGGGGSSRGSRSSSGVAPRGCHMHRISPGLALDSDGAVDLLNTKRRSVFCAEPGGHNRIRKGVVDAVLCGCIPVLFLRPTEVRRLWPLHWFGWRNESTVVVRPEAVLEGGIDVIAMLASIPTEQVVAMQQSIAKNAHRLAYLHERQYDGDDAIDVLLKGMAFGLPG
jgi:hypothetical protein